MGLALMEPTRIGLAVLIHAINYWLTYEIRYLFDLTIDMKDSIF